MNKPFVLLAALALAAGTAAAQAPVKTTGTDANQNALHQNLQAKGGAKPGKTPAQKADHKAGKMAKELGLSPDQEARMEKLLLDRQQESMALKTKYGADRKAGRAEMKAAHDRYETSFKAILTPEQFAKYQQKKDEHHDKTKDAKLKMKAKA